ncbi:4Fe-4S dicluster domain-containing protein [Acidocella aromatica]|uniref:Ferredoxin n=1 Tax=Acidocella aromatica TaxID=1303579 RepID=A0A840VS79_9PROT|nr:4Fe-4S dicluster domain-containing protein [Acidocella aromatica]MBB5373102.1 ferredoxin [Acidocella aromatica]
MQQATAAIRVLAPEALQDLISALAATRVVLGPVRRDGAIVYDEISRLDDLPAGWTDRQEAGQYRLEPRTDAALFGYAVGPHSWKQFLLPPREVLFTTRQTADGLDFLPPPAEERTYAFIGVRACELAAIAVQDKVLRDGPYADTAYAARRENAFIVAVNCGTAAPTCFCASMNTGPKAAAGYDIALTELLDGRHEFLAEAGSEAGEALLAALPSRPASAGDLAAAEAVTVNTAAAQTRALNTENLPAQLAAAANHPHWQEVAQRCLSCGNCTMVCPTCFCTTVADHTDLTTADAQRVRSWDSCFTLDFSYLHGGSVRQSTAARYRQWLTHKLSTWVEQFGTMGCVGCGRCITWCPTGIDLVAEATALREAQNGNS